MYRLLTAGPRRRGPTTLSPPRRGPSVLWLLHTVATPLCGPRAVTPPRRGPCTHSQHIGTVESSNVNYGACKAACVLVTQAVWQIEQLQRINSPERAKQLAAQVP